MNERFFQLLDRAYLGLSRPFGRWLRARALVDLRAAQSPAKVDPPAGRILVLAPHPDDESIGCGGLILTCHDPAENVHIVLMTGGEQGRTDWEEDATANTRREEMVACCRALGVGQMTLLPGEDQQLATQPDLTAGILQVLRSFSPDVVCVPFFMDAHPDHVATNRLFLAAAGVALPGDTPIWAYEVWSPCPANAAIDISGVIEQKCEAIRLHASQDSQMRYAEAIAGLNRYRAMQINWQADPTLTHAEAYLRLPLAEYRELAEAWWEISGAPAETETAAAEPVPEAGP